MLLFVSDLHLADRLEASPADVPALLAALEACLTRAFGRGVERAKLVLLGDIFELLKSESWLESSARPWLEPTAESERIVDGIFAAIAREHAAFFAGLRALTVRFPGLELEYLPGNHDREMGTAAGAGARAELRRLLPLPGSGSEPFPSLLLDPEHGVLAKHGHEWDRQNRSHEGLSAIGDVVVIELVARLPFAVRRQLGKGPLDPGLSFLEELDNVRPAHPEALVAWLLTGLMRLGAGAEAARRAVSEALAGSVEAFGRALHEARFEVVESRLWSEALAALLKALLSWTDLRALAPLLPRSRAVHETASHSAELDLVTAAETGSPCRFCVSGHTHHAETVPLALAAGSAAVMYLNTGTWRRVHTRIDHRERGGRASFATWSEDCLTSIFSPEEQQRGLPTFEVIMQRRGIAHGR